MGFDNRPRYYAKCQCGHTTILFGSKGGFPPGAVRCSSCETTINLAKFRLAYTGARWEKRFYESIRKAEGKG